MIRFTSPGLQGPQGEPGSSITFKATVATVAELNALTGMSEDDARVVEENGHIYIYDGSSWIDGGQFLGPQGEQGPEGPQGEPGPAADSVPLVKHEVKAGESLTIGQAVYVSSADGTNMIVSKASNTLESTSSKTMGLISSSLNHNDIGYVVTEGLLAGLNTEDANAGDPVWLGTNGNLIYGLVNKPIAPAHLVFIGIVTRSNQNNGEIFVRPQNGFELNEIHNVLIGSSYASTPSDNDLLAYDTTSGLWKNQTKSEAGIPTSLNGLTDVTLSETPLDKQLLVYDNSTSQWINANPIDSTGIAYKEGVPASPTSTGQVGQLAIDGANAILYVCTSTNNWQKVSLNSANFTNPGGFI